MVNLLFVMEDIQHLNSSLGMLIKFCCLFFGVDMGVKIIIVGVGGFGKELASILISESLYLPASIVFVDDSFDNGVRSVECLGNSIPIIGNISDHCVKQEYDYFCSITNFSVRQQIIERLTRKGAKFVTIVSKSAYIIDSRNIGIGCFIAANTFISSAVKIHNHVLLNYGNSVGHDAEIGAYSVISPNCSISGNSRLGDNVFLGSGATIAPKVQVCSRSKISTGVNVLKDVKKPSLVFNKLPKIMKYEEV